MSIRTWIKVAASGFAWTVITVAQMGGIKLQLQHSADPVSYPKFENGYFANFDSPDRDVSSIPVYVYDRTGKVAATVVLSIPESHATIVLDVAVSNRGQIAVAGGATSMDSRSTDVIAFFGQGGEAQAIMRTDDFVPRQISFSPDGTLWALGGEFDAQRMRLPECNVLRQYSSSGKLIRSALPSAGPLFTPKLRTINGARLAVSSETVAVWFPHNNQMVEISSKTGELVRQAAGPVGEECIFLGLTSSGSAFLTCSTESRDITREFDAESKQWKLVPGLDGAILGAEGEQLVLRGPAGIRWASR